jgi:hypothetical protein
VQTFTNELPGKSQPHHAETSIKGNCTMKMLKMYGAEIVSAMFLFSLLAVLLIWLSSGSSNIALHKPVFASGTYIDCGPDKAVDGDTNTSWNAGTYHPAFLEVDLEGSFTIDSINVKLNQTPEGQTVFQAWVYNGNDSTMVTRWSGHTKMGSWLLCGFGCPLERVDRIRICSEYSPSWIAFLEVAVIGRMSTR